MIVQIKKFWAFKAQRVRNHKTIKNFFFYSLFFYLSLSLDLIRNSHTHTHLHTLSLSHTHLVQFKVVSSIKFTEKRCQLKLFSMVSGVPYFLSFLYFIMQIGCRKSSLNVILSTNIFSIHQGLLSVQGGIVIRTVLSVQVCIFILPKEGSRYPHL